MRALIISLVIVVVVASCGLADSLSDRAGVVRLFGDTSSWMSTCFVVGDGSWVITTYDSITEQIGPDTSQTIKYPLFISPYTGQAYQCELKASDKELNVALLKLPVSGLPAAPLAKISEFSKAASGTTGQLSSGEVVGNAWPTTIFGITLDRSATPAKLGVNEWKAGKVFVTDMGKYKWMFINGIKPIGSVPNGSMVARDSIVAGMYVSKLSVTGGQQDVVYGQCAMAPEIARFCGDAGLDTATLYDPPKPTIARPSNADVAFQLQARIYSLIAARRPGLALPSAVALANMRPKDAQAQVSLGLAQLGAGKAEEALKAFDSAAGLDPKLPALRINRALALDALKKTSEAEAELQKAAEESPNDVRPISALADFYLASDKTIDKALIYAKKAAAMSPNSAAAELRVGKVEKSKKDYQAAVIAIGEAIKMAPKWGEAWYALGTTYEEAGDKANAEKAYRTLVEKQPTNPDSLLTLASFLADQGNRSEASEIIAKVRGMAPAKEVLEAAQALQDKIDGKKAEKK